MASPTLKIIRNFDIIVETQHSVSPKIKSTLKIKCNVHENETFNETFKNETFTNNSVETQHNFDIIVGRWLQK